MSYSLCTHCCWQASLIVVYDQYILPLFCVPVESQPSVDVAGCSEKDNVQSQKVNGKIV